MITSTANLCFTNSYGLAGANLLQVLPHKLITGYLAGPGWGGQKAEACPELPVVNYAESELETDHLHFSFFRP